jgi:hypothetical protein
MNSLYELTGQESGIIIYHYKDGSKPEAVICNWSDIAGLPVIDSTGQSLQWHSETISEAQGAHSENICAMLQGVDIVYTEKISIPSTGKVYRTGSYTVITPDGWL